MNSLAQLKRDLRYARSTEDRIYLLYTAYDQDPLYYKEVVHPGLLRNPYVTGRSNSLHLDTSTALNIYRRVRLEKDFLPLYLKLYSIPDHTLLDDLYQLKSLSVSVPSSLDFDRFQDTNLTLLYLTCHTDFDFSRISSLTNLEKLNITHTRGTFIHIKHLQRLTKLKTLVISTVDRLDLMLLKGMKDLEHLNLEHCPSDNLDILYQLKGLHHLGLPPNSKIDLTQLDSSTLVWLHYPKNHYTEYEVTSALPNVICAPY